MNRTAWQWVARTFAVVAAVALAAACASEAPVGPNGGILESNAVLERGIPELGSCQHLKPPAGATLVNRVYAQGVQIYQWNGSSWSFVAPSAVLTADAGGNGIVGTHYAGPTWESLSGGTVVGTVLDRCTPDASAVAWLLLSAVADGPGIFHRVTHIQRVNTVGGIAPATPGSVVGQEARIPYTTEYLFYRTS